MIRLFLTALVAFSSTQIGLGQAYHMIKDIPTDEHVLPIDNVNKIYFRVCHDTAYLIRAISGKNGGLDYRVALFNLETGKTLHCDTISNIPGSFRVTDVQIHNRKIVMTAYGKLLYFDLAHPTSVPFFFIGDLEYPKKNNDFDHCDFMNDTVVLLNTIYDYHPLDGKSGIHLTTFDLKAMQCRKSKVLKFPGISVSGVTNNWITILKNRIYIITPLSSLMYSLNFNLESIDTIQTGIFTKQEHDSSLAYEHSVDSIAAEASAQVTKIMSKYPPDSLQYHRSEFLNDVYSKDFLLKVLKDIQQLAFVRQIFTIDDSLIAICSSKPNEQEPSKDYRDVIFYDPSKRKIVKRYRHLSNSYPVDNLLKPEDFFIMEFWDKLHRPYIHNGYGYYYSLFPLSSFHPGKYEDLSLELLTQARKNGYKWTIKKYKFD